MRFPKPSHAVVVAYLALAVALSGSTAVAVEMFTGRNIVDGSLKGADVKDGSLTGVDVKDSSVRRGDIAPNARPAAGSIVLVQSSSPCPAGTEYVRGVVLQDSLMWAVGDAMYRLSSYTNTVVPDESDFPPRFSLCRYQ